MLCLLVLMQLGTELLLAPPDVPEPDVDIHLDLNSLGTPLCDQETGLGPGFELWRDWSVLCKYTRVEFDYSA